MYKPGVSTMWDAIIGIIEEMKKCEEAEAIFAALAMAYVCIDTMAYLSMPESQSEQRRQDFIDWVNTYLRGHPHQPYQYNGIDVYAARCALLHTFGTEAKIHREDPSITMFGYHNGGMHKIDLNISPKLVINGGVSER